MPTYPRPPAYRLVTSSTNPRVHYAVSPESCTCLAFHFLRRKDPAYRCKHMEEFFPFLCMSCGQAPALPKRLECSTCSNARRERDAAARLRAALADVEWPE